MVMKKDRRKRDIKTKLLAAICMLMVSCIMVVSSTYAWFTLSTAPEVTGISTAVGANGNLEMALLPSADKDGNLYASAAEALAAIGNSTTGMSNVQINSTWGNLVDLSDTSYGMDKITLYPATMEVEEGGKIPTNFLSTPVYGADGRFNGLNKTAFSAIHTNGSFGTSGFGVRAVGTSSGMSGLEMAYRSALTTANGAFNSAIERAKATVSTGGSTLASMAVNKATNPDATFAAGDVAALVTAYTNFQQTLGYVETALRNYIIADYLSSGIDAVSETTYDAIVTTISNASVTALADYANDTMDGYLTKLATLQSTVKTNLEGLEALSGDTYTWDQIDDYVTDMAALDGMLLNGHPMSYWMEKNEAGAFANLGELISNMRNLVMEVNTNGTDTGLFAQLADFIDTFSTPVTINGIEYNGISADGLEVTMRIKATASPCYLNVSKTEANTYAGNPFGAGGNLISDFYGYIIDMGFRTNAAGSNLLLQTDAIDRVYADNDSNPATMGGGSTMTFTVPASGFTREQVANLMTFIRVVFFDPTSSNIFCYARLDINTAEYALDDEGNTTVTLDLKKWDPTLNDGQGAWAKDSVITSLSQNIATAVSTMVYLEGEEISNGDIATVALTGKMNLQFASSAELNPMEYGDLREGTEEEETFNVTVNGLAAGTVKKGASYTYDLSGVTLPDGESLTDYDIAVTMGSQPVADAVTGNTVSISDVNGDIVVTLTKKSP